MVAPFASPDLDDCRLHPLLLSLAANKGGGKHLHPLVCPYPSELEWSIPFIHVTDQVNKTSFSERNPTDHFSSCADF